jgi:hypothetical protein
VCFKASCEGWYRMLLKWNEHEGVGLHKVMLEYVLRPDNVPRTIVRICITSTFLKGNRVKEWEDNKED